MSIGRSLSLTSLAIIIINNLLEIILAHKVYLGEDEDDLVNCGRAMDGVS